MLVVPLSNLQEAEGEEVIVYSEDNATKIMLTIVCPITLSYVHVHVNRYVDVLTSSC